MQINDSEQQIEIIKESPAAELGPIQSNDVLKVILRQEKPFYLQYCTKELIIDYFNILSSTCENNKNLVEELSYLNPNMMQDTDILTIIIRNHPSFLQTIKDYETIKDNEEIYRRLEPHYLQIVAAALKIDGTLLQYLEEDIKNEPHLLIIAIANNPEAFKFAPKNIQKELALMTLARNTVVTTTTTRMQQELQQTQKSTLCDKTAKEKALEAIYPSKDLLTQALDNIASLPEYIEQSQPKILEQTIRARVEKQLYKAKNEIALRNFDGAREMIEIITTRVSVTNKNLLTQLREAKIALWKKEIPDLTTIITTLSQHKSIIPINIYLLAKLVQQLPNTTTKQKESIDQQKKDCLNTAKLFKRIKQLPNELRTQITHYLSIDDKFLYLQAMLMRSVRVLHIDTVKPITVTTNTTAKAIQQYYCEEKTKPNNNNPQTTRPLSNN